MQKSNMKKINAKNLQKLIVYLFIVIQNIVERVEYSRIWIPEEELEKSDKNAIF